MVSHSSSEKTRTVRRSLPHLWVIVLHPGYQSSVPYCVDIRPCKFYPHRTIRAGAVAGFQLKFGVGMHEIITKAERYSYKLHSEIRRKSYTNNYEDKAGSSTLSSCCLGFKSLRSAGLPCGTRSLLVVKASICARNHGAVCPLTSDNRASYSTSVLCMHCLDIS